MFSFSAKHYKQKMKKIRNNIKNKFMFLNFEIYYVCFLLKQDTTPLPRPVRSCTKKTPVPKRLLDQTEPMAVDEAHPAVQNVAELEMEKKTPKRYIKS